MRKYNWNKKGILQVTISGFIGLGAWQTANRFQLRYGDQFDTVDSKRFLWQFLMLVAWAGVIYCILHLKYLIPNQLKTDLFNAAVRAFKKVGAGINRAYYAIRHALGIPDPPKRIKAKDEHSFIFEEEEDGLLRRFRNLGSGMKWKDLKNNADKIRFIYIKYINRLMKKGYRYSAILTPMETLNKWKLEKDESAYMFPLYTDARYSGGRRPITDEEVERSYKYMKVNAKIGK